MNAEQAGNESLFCYRDVFAFSAIGGVVMFMAAACANEDAAAIAKGMTFGPPTNARSTLMADTG